MPLTLSRRGAWLIVLAIGAVTAVLGFQARRFEIDASADTLLTRNNEKYIEYTLLQQVFEPEEFLLVAYCPTGEPLFSPATFGRLRRLSAELRELERVRSVRSLLNVPLPTLAGDTGIAEVDPEALTVDKAGWTPATVAPAFRNHPIYTDLLVDDEQTVTALQVVFEPDAELAELARQKAAIRRGLQPGADPDEEQKAELARLDARMAPLERRLTEQRHEELEQIRAIVAGYEQHADIYLGGAHALGKQLVDIVRSDLIVFGAVVFVLIALVVLLLFRDWRWILIVTACCASGIVCAVGLFGTLGLEATAVSANFVALQLILTLAMVVHLIVRFRELSREHPEWSHERRVGKTLRTKSVPILYAAGTTVIGFGSLLITGIQPVISFGWMMAIAVTVSLAVTLSLFPALLTVTGDGGSADEPAWLRRGLGRLAGAVLARPRPVLAAAGVLFLACGLAMLRLSVENTFIDYFDDDTDAHRELSFIDRRLGGTTPLDIVVRVPPAPGDLLLEAETFTDLQKLQALVERHAGIGKVLSLVNFTAVAREVNDGRPVTEYEMTAVYMLMDEALRESLIGSYYSPQTNQVRLAIRVVDTTAGLDRAALLESVRDDVQAVFGADADYSVSNLFVLYEDIITRLARSQWQSLVVVLVALLLAFLVFFRSLRLALIALAPNVLVVAAVFGTMAAFAIPLDLMTMTIAAVAMGIGVDDTVHYVHRYLEERGSADAADAVRRTNTSVGVAACYTTFILVAGFLALVFSDFVPTTLFGVLTGVALSTALLFDLTVLPSLLARFAPRR